MSFPPIWENFSESALCGLQDENMHELYWRRATFYRMKWNNLCIRCEESRALPHQKKTFSWSGRTHWSAVHPGCVWSPSCLRLLHLKGSKQVTLLFSLFGRWKSPQARLIPKIRLRRTLFHGGLLLHCLTVMQKWRAEKVTRGSQRQPFPELPLSVRIVNSQSNTQSLFIKHFKHNLTKRFCTVN